MTNALPGSAATVHAQSPHVGPLKRRIQDFKESPFRNMHCVEAPLTDEGQVVPHQTFFRILVGRAENWQACLVRRTRAWKDVPDGSIPDWVLGGPWPTVQTDWLWYPPTDRQALYWFTGVHSPPGGGNWRPDHFTAYSVDQHEGGTVATVYFDDTLGDLDADDLIVEVAVVFLDRSDAVRPVEGQSNIAAEVAKAVEARTSP